MDLNNYLKVDLLYIRFHPKNSGMSCLLRILRWLCGGIGIFAAIALLVFLYAPYADGPIGPFGYIAGGRLDGPVAVFPDDPSVWADLLTVELETNPKDPRSVTVGLLVVDGVAFVPATLTPNTKRWPRDVERDGNVRVRVDGRIYRARATRIHDPRLHERLANAGQRKYQPSFFDPERTWFYRLDSPI